MTAVAPGWLVPELDFTVLAELVRRPDQYGAAVAFRDLLAAPCDGSGAPGAARRVS